MNSRDLLGLLGLGFGIYQGVKTKKSKQEAEAQRRALIQAAVANAVAQNYKNKLMQKNLSDEEIVQRMQKYRPDTEPGYASLYSTYLLTGKFPGELYNKLYPAGPKTIKYDYSGLRSRNRYSGSPKNNKLSNYQKRSDAFLKAYENFIPSDESFSTLYERAGKADAWAKQLGLKPKYVDMVRKRHAEYIKEQQKKGKNKPGFLKQLGTNISNFFTSQPEKPNVTSVKKLQKKLLKNNQSNPFDFTP